MHLICKSQKHYHRNTGALDSYKSYTAVSSSNRDILSPQVLLEYLPLLCIFSTRIFSFTSDMCSLNQFIIRKMFEMPSKHRHVLIYLILDISIVVILIGLALCVQVFCIPLPSKKSSSLDINPRRRRTRTGRTTVVDAIPQTFEHTENY
jgi:hypothetical protein